MRSNSLQNLAAEAKNAVPIRNDAQAEEIFARFDSKVVGRFWQFVRPHRWTLVASLTAVGFYTLVQLGIPLTVKYAVDSAVGTTSLSLNQVLSVFAALIIVNFGLNFLQEWITARLAQRVIFSLRRAMFAHLQTVSMGLLEQTQVGHLMARLQGDVNALQEFMESSISALGDFFLLIGIVIVLLVLNWQLGLLTLAVLPLLVFVRSVWLPWARKAFRRARVASSSVNAALAENINGIRTVQENRREQVNFQRYRVKAQENLDAQIGSSHASQIMVPLVDVLTGLAMAVVVLFGGHLVLTGALGVGAMVAYLFYVQRFFDPVRMLSMQYTVMQRAMAAGHRIFEVLDLPVTLRDKPDASELALATPAIEFRNVTFGYRPGQPVLHDINLQIPAFNTIALVGPTGSGKTSITALLHRFYDVWGGQVLVDGQDVRDVTLESLGKNIGMVLQEPFLFSGTVLENLRYGIPDASREEVIAAAKAVRAHDFIEHLPNGYNTELGQRGCNLSVGQRQLLSFARTLLTDPKILVLDEATANIDSFTELEIQKALKVLSRGRTCIIIAHRLATVRDADSIVVLNRGHIIEQGSHDELLKVKGLYYHLHASSQESFDDAYEFVTGAARFE